MSSRASESIVLVGKRLHANTLGAIKEIASGMFGDEDTCVRIRFETFATFANFFFFSILFYPLTTRQTTLFSKKPLKALRRLRGISWRGAICGRLARRGGRASATAPAGSWLTRRRRWRTCSARGSAQSTISR
jgi:hypothetical protein